MSENNPETHKRLMFKSTTRFIDSKTPPSRGGGLKPQALNRIFVEYPRVPVLRGVGNSRLWAQRGRRPPPTCGCGSHNP